MKFIVVHNGKVLRDRTGHALTLTVSAYANYNNL